MRKVERKHQEALENPDNILSQVTKRIIEKSDIMPEVSSVELKPSKSNPKNPPNIFPNLNKKERKLIYKILDVIRENIDAKKFDELQSKIVEAVNK